MAKLRKLPIGELIPSGIDGLLFLCEGRGCGHLAEVDLATATGRWGRDTLADSAACS